MVVEDSCEKMMIEVNEVGGWEAQRRADCHLVPSFDRGCARRLDFFGRALVASAPANGSRLSRGASSRQYQ